MRRALFHKQKLPGTVLLSEAPRTTRSCGPRYAENALAYPACQGAGALIENIRWPVLLHANISKGEKESEHMFWLEYHHLKYEFIPGEFCYMPRIMSSGYRKYYLLYYVHAIRPRFVLPFRSTFVMTTYLH